MKFKVGDMVYCSHRGRIGKIIKISDHHEYPIRVEFGMKNCSDIYTSEGNLYSDRDSPLDKNFIKHLTPLEQVLE